MTAILAWYRTPSDYGIAADSWIDNDHGVGWPRRKIASAGPIAVACSGSVAVAQRVERAILSRLAPEQDEPGVESLLRDAWAEVEPHAPRVEPRYLPETGCYAVVLHPVGMFVLWPAGEASRPETWWSIGCAEGYLLGWVDGRTAQLTKVYGMHATIARMAVDAACERFTSCRGPVVVWEAPR